MHFISDAQKRIQEFVSENSATLLTAGGVVGTVATAVLAGRAGFKAATIIHSQALQIVPDEDRTVGKDFAGLPDLTLGEKLKLTGLHFVPPVITGSATVASIIMANRMSAQRAAALAAAYGLTQKQFDEYRAKVAEKLTGPKNQQITDELAQDDVDRTPGATNLVVISGDEVLCFDRPTGRYFKSTMEKLNSAVHSTNEEIINHGYAAASYFYSELELPDTTWSDNVGWNLDNTLKLDITTTQAEDGRPCLAINFARFPVEDFHRQVY
jgi:Family of unknown function (DUF6353)